VSAQRHLPPKASGKQFGAAEEHLCRATGCSWKLHGKLLALGTDTVLSGDNTEGAATHAKPCSEEAANIRDGNASLSSLLLPFCSTTLF